MNHIKFGEFIKLKRVSKGIRGTHIAKTAEVTRASLYNIENGINIPKLDTVFGLLKGVGESLESFAAYLKLEESNEQL